MAMAEWTETGSGFRRQAVATANLLLEAASILHNYQNSHLGSHDELSSSRTVPSNSQRNRLSLHDRIIGSQANASCHDELSGSSTVPSNSQQNRLYLRDRALGLRPLPLITTN